ncbi:MAG TPA: hypothetical protein DCE78_09095 [Bacteroidetes bacterium]|nr:hypothetical protein [Bacteroidota bacterium]
MFHVKHRVTASNVSRETLELVENQKMLFNDQFELFTSVILQWNKKINLVSRDVSKSELLLHIHHSLMVQYAKLWDSGCNRVIDAGSGGGLPGVPLSIVSNNEILMVDVVEKKMLALNQIIKSLKIANSRSFHQNIESLSTTEDDLYVSKHAFKLSDFFELTKNQKYLGAIFLKGDGFIKELDLCEQALDVEYIVLDEIHKDPFYKGKYVLSIKRQN